MNFTKDHKENRVNLVGQLKQADVVDSVTSKGVPYRRGTLIVLAAGNEFKVNFFEQKTYKNGNENGKYNQVAQLQNGQLVSLQCSFRENKFVGSDGSLVKNQELSLNFINQPRETDVEGLTFGFTGFVVSPLSEVRDEQGNLTHFSMKIAQSEYIEDLGMLVAEFAVDPLNQQAVQYIQSSYPVGATAKIGGIGKASVVTREVVKEAMFGESEKQVFQNHIQRFYIESGFEVSELGKYTPEMIELLKANTLKAEENLKSKSSEAAKPADGFSKPAATASATSLLGL